jgi:hypothetical protein
MLYSLSEAYVTLVGAAVFKTDVARNPGQAGSIPVRLRHHITTPLPGC